MNMVGRKLFQERSNLIYSNAGTDGAVSLVPVAARRRGSPVVSIIIVPGAALCLAPPHSEASSAKSSVPCGEYGIQPGPFIGLLLGPTRNRHKCLMRH